MKLSFSLQSKSSTSSSKPNPKPQKFEDDDVTTTATAAAEFVTEFDSTKPSRPPAAAIIPPIPNEWRPAKRMKNLETLTSDGTRGELEFESETINTTDHADDNMSYGLNIRKGANSDKKGSSIRVMETSSSSLETVMLQKLKRDLDRLPEDRGMDEFVDRPVEGFGAALLAGYGWTEGKGIGKNAKEDMKVVEVKKHNFKEGLGYSSANSRKSNVSSKQDDKPDNKRSRDNDEAVQQKSDKEEYVSRRNRDTKEEGHRKSDKETGSKRKSGAREVGDRKSDYGRLSWLRSHIRVRIISKDFKRGRFYLKKAEVLDVIDPTTCDICIDETKEIIQSVDQEYLETALPKRGGPVLVLSGKHKGVFGSLVEKDLDRETGVVRDADSHSLLSVKLDHIAEYVGDPSVLGLINTFLMEILIYVNTYCSEVRVLLETCEEEEIPPIVHAHGGGSRKSKLVCVTGLKLKATEVMDMICKYLEAESRGIVEIFQFLVLVEIGVPNEPDEFRSGHQYHLTRHEERNSGRVGLRKKEKK
ncbi:hypothetical protein ACFE04_001457 [Oxalis oulophora]